MGHREYSIILNGSPVDGQIIGAGAASLQRRSEFVNPKGRFCVAGALDSSFSWSDIEEVE
jgi:hypothetical protein